MLESVHRIGIMTSPIKKEVRKRKINLVLRIGHPEDEDFEAMRRSAEQRGNGLEPCRDHRHHQKMMLHQHRTQTGLQHSLQR